MAPLPTQTAVSAPKTGESYEAWSDRAIAELAAQMPALPEGWRWTMNPKVEKVGDKYVITHVAEPMPPPAVFRYVGNGMYAWVRGDDAGFVTSDGLAYQRS
jgi:hypothetical protein